MNYVKLAVILSLVLFCSCQSAPKIMRCTIINKDVAECVSPQRSVEPKDKPIRKMRGYQCLSPDDVAAARMYLKSILDRL